MQLALAIVAALFGASAIATPAPKAIDVPNPSEDIAVNNEDIVITNFTVHKKESGTITKVNFNLTGLNATDLACEGANIAKLPSKVINCGDSKYSFTLREPTKTEFTLRIYHELGIGVGFWGQGNVLTHCRAGGKGELLCTQVKPRTKIVIDNTPPPVIPK